MNTKEVKKVGGNYSRMLNNNLQPILKKHKKVKDVQYSETKNNWAHVCSIDAKTKEGKVGKGDAERNEVDEIW